MLKENQGNQSLQTQLLGQQVLLFEHLTEAKESIKPPQKEEEEEEDKSSKKTPRHSASPPSKIVASTPTDYRMQMLHQQALAAEHQMQAYAAEQQMQQVLAAEQQRQMLMAAEQQRQMQLEQQRQMQMAAMQSSFMSPQPSPYGGAMNPMNSPLYSPYSNPVGFY